MLMWLRVPAFLFVHIFVQCSSVIVNYMLLGSNLHSLAFSKLLLYHNYDEAFADTLVGLYWLYRHKTGVELNFDLTSWNDLLWDWSQTHVFYLLSKSLRGLVVPARSGENLLHMPRNHLRSLNDLGSSMFCIACTFSGPGFMPRD